MSMYLSFFISYIHWRLLSNTHLSWFDFYFDLFPTSSFVLTFVLCDFSVRRLNISTYNTFFTGSIPTMIWRVSSTLIMCVVCIDAFPISWLNFDIRIKSNSNWWRCILFDINWNHFSHLTSVSMYSNDCSFWVLFIFYIIIIIIVLLVSSVPSELAVLYLNTRNMFNKTSLRNVHA